MNLKRIELEGFHNHEGTVLDIPERGLVVVTGDNGSGKSSLVEAVSWAIWGKTLRGTMPGGQDKTPCRAALISDAFLVNRSRKGGKTSLKWRPDDDEKTEWSTTTEAKTALAAIAGDHSLWAKARVFSSHDAAHFTLATDKERKQLLEEVLGLDLFDPALQACRADLNKLKARQAELERRAHVLEERKSGAQSKLDDAQAALENMPAPSPTDAAEISKLAGMLETAKTEHEEAAKQLSEVEHGMDRLTYDISAERGKLETLELSDCPSCFQSIPEEHKDRLRREIEETTGTSEAQIAEMDVQRVNLLQDLLGFEEEYHDLRDMHANLTRKERDARLNASNRARWERSLNAAKDTLRDCEDELETVQHQLTEVIWERSILTHSESILGMKGVRAQTISRALSGLESAANGWLSILGGGLTVTLSDHTTTTTGKTVSALTLGINNAGGGNGYKGASGGERRRVDVALMLGLSAVADASLNRGAGTLFFDEVFDALDSEGVSGVVDVLNQLAADRAVVLVTHSESLVAALKRTAALHVHMVDGMVSQ